MKSYRTHATGKAVVAMVLTALSFLAGATSIKHVDNQTFTFPAGSAVPTEEMRSHLARVFSQMLSHCGRSGLEVVVLEEAVAEVSNERPPTERTAALGRLLVDAGVPSARIHEGSFAVDVPPMYLRGRRTPIGAVEMQLVCTPSD